MSDTPALVVRAIDAGVRPVRLRLPFRFGAVTLRACPQLRILATSREALAIGGETLYRVPSLTLPDPKKLPPLESLRQY